MDTMIRKIMLEHVGHDIQLDERGTSGAVALDCESCGSLLMLWKDGK